MPETFDLIVRGGEVVNHAGRGPGRRRRARRPDRRDRRPAPGLGRRGVRRGGPHRAAGRDRHPGAFPRAGPGVEGRPGERLARRGAGRRHRRLRDAEHRSDHDRRRGVRRQARPRRRAACTATTPSMSAPPAENARSLAELERLPGCCGVKVFMGSSTGPLLVADDAGSARGAGARPPARRGPLRGRVLPDRAPFAGAARRTGPATRCARRRGLRHQVDRAPHAPSPMRPAAASTCCT